MKRLAALAALLTALTGAAHAAPQVNNIPAAEVRATLADAAGIRASLYREAGAQESHAADFVNVTVFGGLPPPDRLTIHLAPDGDLFRAELVIRDRVFEGPPKKARRVVFHLDRRTSRKIAALLANPSLWTEPSGLAASCTDQPVIALDAAWKGRRCQAVRLALVCTPQDATRTLIETVLAQIDRR